MKTKEELNILKAEVQALNKKLVELSAEELKEVIGGTDIDIRKDLYENIILSTQPQEHNIMLADTPENTATPITGWKNNMIG